MTQEQVDTLLRLHRLAIAGKITEREIKFLMHQAAVEVDRSFVKGQDAGRMKKYYNELNSLLDVFRKANEQS